MLKKEIYPIGDIEIVSLTEVTSKFIEDFKCKIKDLNDFLRDDAFIQQQKSVGKTHLWVSKSTKQLLGYITLCSDSIHLEGTDKQKFKDDGIPYKAMPALKIARMAIDEKFVRKKIGSMIIGNTIRKIYLINKNAGCRILTVEAKNDRTLDESEKPIHFYKKLGFKILKERKQDAAYITMYLDVQPYLNAIKKESHRNKMELL